jgi:hypothetical protein
VVRLHVVDDHIVDRTFSDDFMDMFQELGEEVNLDGIYQAYLLVVNEVGVIADTIGQRP